jgi:hypothetical protein
MGWWKNFFCAKDYEKFLPKKKKRKAILIFMAQTLPGLPAPSNEATPVAQP